MTPRTLYHVTTGRNVKKYRESGKIKGPVRESDTLQGAMAWAMKVGREVIMLVHPVTEVHLLPDHHNRWGHAYWTGDAPVQNMICAYSADGSWDAPPGQKQEAKEAI